MLDQRVTENNTKVAFTAENAAYSTQAQCAMALATLSAPSDNEQQRSPISLSLVLDVSGSMAGAKLALVKSTASFLLTHLLETDKLGIIAYDSNVRIPHQLQACPESHQCNRSRICANFAAPSRQLVCPAGGPSR